jgi:hypothetical protein
MNTAPVLSMKSGWAVPEGGPGWLGIFTGFVVWRRRSPNSLILWFCGVVSPNPFYARSGTIGGWKFHLTDKKSPLDPKEKAKPAPCMSSAREKRIRIKPAGGRQDPDWKAAEFMTCGVGVRKTLIIG